MRSPLAPLLQRCKIKLQKFSVQHFSGPHENRPKIRRILVWIQSCNFAQLLCLRKSVEFLQAGLDVCVAVKVRLRGGRRRRAGRRTGRRTGRRGRRAGRRGTRMVCFCKSAVFVKHRIQLLLVLALVSDGRIGSQKPIHDIIKKHFLGRPFNAFGAHPGPEFTKAADVLIPSGIHIRGICSGVDGVHHVPGKGLLQIINRAGTSRQLLPCNVSRRQCRPLFCRSRRLFRPGLGWSRWSWRSTKRPWSGAKLFCNGSGISNFCGCLRHSAWAFKPPRWNGLGWRRWGRWRTLFSW